MKSGWARAICIAGLLLLAGCFQQAGESLQETGSTAEPIQQANPGITLAAPTETSDEPLNSASPTNRPPVSGPVTSTLPPITIIVQPTNPPRNTQAVEPTDSASNGLTEDDDLEATATTIQFITPGIPLGPALDSTPSSLSADGPSATPSGLITPTALGSGADVNISASGVNGECIYVVESGDTLYRIALANDTTVDDIRELNPELEGENPIIQPGQELILPACDGTPDEEATAEVLVEIESTPVPPVIAPSGPMTITATPASTERYIVQPGDTLFIIAQRYGTTVAALVQANNLSNPDRLSIGQELIIPNQP